MDGFHRVASQPNAVSAHVDPSIVGNDKVLKNLLEFEKLHLVSPSYFRLVQTDLTPQMRRIVLDWMLEVCVDRHCDPDVFPLAVSYLDRFLSVVPIRKQQFQQLASACLFIASKVRQTDPISAPDLVFYTDNSMTVSQLMSWEMLVLGTLEWNVTGVTGLDFLPHLEKILASRHVSHILLKRVRSLVREYIPLVSKDLELMALAPSVRAAACVCSALTRCLDVSDPKYLPHALFAAHISHDAKSFVSHSEAVEKFLQTVLQPPKILISALSNASSSADQSVSLKPDPIMYQTSSIRGPA